MAECAKASDQMQYFWVEERPPEEALDVLGEVRVPSGH